MKLKGAFDGKRPVRFLKPDRSLKFNIKIEIIYYP
jgi:hypothetical protein